MRADLTAGHLIVTLSERNLLTLLFMLGVPGSLCTVESGNVFAGGALVSGVLLTVHGERDDLHYGERVPGLMAPHSEAFLERQRREVALTDAHPVCRLIELRIGPLGRMLACSASGYRRAYPDHVVLLSGVVVAVEPVSSLALPVWHGDLDLTVDECGLQQIAVVSRHGLAVLREQPETTETSGAEAPQRALIEIGADGVVWFDESAMVRVADGSLRRRDRTETT